ncbi:hypothetical protein [Rasiella sp. SM2506]|uniref:hypothetical protein n=1 Tax=Rasiella sp. SM2506 TaxID=3423914 RepID=UPI003D79BF50
MFNVKPYNGRIVLVLAVLLLFGVIFILKFTSSDTVTIKMLHKPDKELVAEIEKRIVISSEPSFLYSYAPFKEGVIQHLDRDYTYDVIPHEMEGGMLFQGIHRPPNGTKIKLDLKQPSTVYFFFHDIFDGGYTIIFNKLANWKQLPVAPKYDSSNGTHGLSMILFKADLEKGVYNIPATTQDKACFSIVVMH